MIRSRLAFRLGVLLALIFACLPCAHAQHWRQIGGLPPAADLRCAYFWDTAYGVVGGVGCIYTYRNGNWTEAGYPEQADTIKSLRLLDSAHLYAAGGVTDVWVSTDRGATWNLTGTGITKADDIYLGMDGKVHGMNFAGTGMMRGTTFARIDSLHCCVARDDDMSLAYSGDGGMTWANSSTPFEGASGYTVVADPCTGTFYTLTDGLKRELFSSTDGGDTWTLRKDFTNTVWDNLDGGLGGVLYVRARANNLIYRSLDGGGSFTTLWVPINPTEDRRMFAFGDVDRSLIILNGGGVWLWDDSTTLRAGERFAISSTEVPPARSCDTDLIPFVITTPPCFRVDQLLAIDAASSTPSLQVDSALSDLGHLKNADTVWFRYVQNWPTKGTYLFRLQGHTKSGFRIDTTLPVTLTSIKPDNPLASVNAVIKDPCADARIPVLIKNPTCGVWHIDSMVLTGSQSIATIPSGFDSSVGPDQTDTIWLTSNLSQSGILNGRVMLYLTYEGALLSYDTSLLLSIDVRAATSRVVAEPSLSLSNCKPSIVPLLLQSLACGDSVLFSSYTISLDKTLQYTTNLVLPQTLAPSEIDSLLISVPPQGLSGTYVFTVRVKGKYIGSNTPPFDTTVHIRVVFANSSNALTPQYLNEITLNTLTLCIGAKTDTTATFTNLGCDTITVTGDQSQWQPGWSATDPQFPFTLAPDSSFTVTIHYSPPGLAYSSQTVVYGFEYEGGKTGTAQSEFVGQAISPTASLALSISGIDFGTFSRCNASSDTTITITNTGCDSLSVSGISLDAGAGFTLTSGSDTELMPDQSAHFTIHFADSVTGTFHSAFHITGVGTDGGNTIDTTVPITAKIIPGSYVASIDKTSIDFGTTSICDERNSSVTIKNNGCEAITILQGSFSSLQFVFDAAVHFPITLLPDSSMTFPIFTQLDTTGHPNVIVGTLDFATNPTTPISPVSLTRSVTYPVAFSLSLAAESMAKIATIIQACVLRTGTIPAQADEVDFDLVYNDNLLSYDSTFQPDIKPIGITLLPDGSLDRSFAMRPATDRDTIATLQFKTYLTKDTRTAIQLTHQQFLVAGTISPGCVAVMDTTAIPNNFMLQLSCGDTTILAAWNSAPPFSIESIQPNPAGNEITLKISGTALPNMEMYDELGRTLPIPLSSFIPHPSSFSVDVSQVPPGSYFLRFSFDGYVQTRRISVVR